MSKQRYLESKVNVEEGEKQAEDVGMDVENVKLEDKKKVEKIEEE